jgi:hypothetical protein
MSGRHLLAVVTGALVALLIAQPALATSVTPMKYGKWRQGQQVAFQWKSDARPPSWMRSAIVDAADDAGSTSGAKAATFNLADSASSWIGYTEEVCTDTALGCNWNNAPTSFTVRLRPQGWTFDWGTLRWCQFYDTWPDGCFDVEMITLHEMGHAQGLGHIDDAPDPGDWVDSVMHAVSHAKPKVGWNAHGFGRCDDAALQAAYQPLTAATPISTCLWLGRVVSVSAAGSVAYRAAVKFTATLATADDVAYPKLRSLPLSNRTVLLQYKSTSGTSWITLGQMAPTTTDGQYVLSQTVTTTYDWRVSFAAPAGEGLLADVSPSVRVSVGDCTSACPLRAPGTQGGGR